LKKADKCDYSKSYFSGSTLKKKLILREVGSIEVNSLFVTINFVCRVNFEHEKLVQKMFCK